MIAGIVWARDWFFLCVDVPLVIIVLLIIGRKPKAKK